MTHASLFSGIGGFDLAAEWAGFKNVFHCEIDPFCQKILNHHFPNSISYDNIKTTDFTKHRGGITVLSGGFPCQPFSVSGKRKGANDDRYLWPEMLRVIREIRPTWIIGENVNGITSMVLPTEEIGVEGEATNGETDRVSEFVIERICKELEAEGYTVQPIIIPACGVGAPHKRDRVWFLAYRTDSRIEKVQQSGANRIFSIRPTTNPHCDGRDERRTDSGWQKEDTQIWADIFSKFERLIKEWTPTDTQNNRLSPCAPRQEQKQPWGTDERIEFSNYWEDFPTQSPVCCGDDGISTELDSITFPKWRRESIKAYGNAIVPQVAYRILSMIITIKNAHY